MVSKKIKVPSKLKKLGFKKIHQDKDGFFMFGLTPSKLNKGGKDHVKSSNNKFFETRDYSMFKKVRGNRPVDQAHVKQLKKLIAEKDLMDPIRVNSNIEVVDGQHTLQARKELD